MQDAGKDENALAKLVVKYRTALRLAAELLIYGMPTSVFPLISIFFNVPGLSARPSELCIMAVRL
jgi:hypothetical protein